jgi:WD40 repeat protein
MPAVFPEMPKPDRQVIPWRTLGKAADIRALDLSPDGKRLLAAENRECHIPHYVIAEWDLERGVLRRRWNSGHEDSHSFSFLRYSPSGRYFLAGHLDSFIAVRNLKGRLILAGKSVEDCATGLKAAWFLEHGGVSVLTAVSTGIAKKTSVLKNETSTYHLASDDLGIDAAAATRDGSTLVCCGAFMKVYSHGDFGTPRRVNSFRRLRDSTSEWDPCCTRAAVSDDGVLVLVYDYGCNVETYDPKTNRVSKRYCGGVLGLLDVKMDRLVKRWRPQEEDEEVFAILPFYGRHWFATGHSNGEIKIWNERGGLVCTLDDKLRTPIYALAMTPDNSFLACAGEERPITIWDLRVLVRREMRQKR